MTATLTDHDGLARDAIQSLLNGEAPNNGYDQADFGPWTNVVDSIRSAYQVDGATGARKAFDALARQDLALAMLLAGDQDELAAIGEVPPLPKGAQPDPGLGRGAGAWLDDQVEYANKISPMTPRLFHEGAALAMVSTIVARRLKLALHYGDIYPNLFILWLAPTTLWRKTTGLNVVRRMLCDNWPHLLTTQDMTPEGLLSDLAGREPSHFDALTEQDKALWKEERNFAAQRALVLDEMSGLMAGAGKDYNQGLVESLLRFYDCDPLYARSTRGQGRIVVRNSCLTTLGASTPAALAPHLTSERLWSMGWWPRFAILTPDTDKPGWQRSQEPGDPPIEPLADLYDRLPLPAWPDPPEARAVTLGTGTYDAWEAYNRAAGYDLLTDGEVPEILWGAYGRLAEQALKVAILLAALDWPDGTESPCIEMPHLARAIAITETWRASVHRAISKTQATQLDRIQQRIVRQLSKAGPAGMTYRDLRQGMRDMQADELKEALYDLCEMNTAEEKAWQNPKGGRKTKVFRLVNQ